LPSQDLLMNLDKALKRMAGHEAEDGSADRLLSITKAVTSNYYYTPSLSELEKLENLSISEDEQKVESKSSGKQEMEEFKDNNNELKPKEEKKDEIKVIIEYCTNCGYKTIFNEKVKLLQMVSDRITVIGNPMFPRLSAFEITLADGTVLWTKLKHPSGDGRNNYPHVFPTNEQLLEAVEKHLGLKFTGKIPESLIYTEVCTRVGVW